jgi:hypothetical protein
MQPVDWAVLLALTGLDGVTKPALAVRQGKQGRWVTP